MMSCLNVTGSRTCSCVSLLSIARHPPAFRFDFFLFFLFYFYFFCFVSLRLSALHFSVSFSFVFPHYSAPTIGDFGAPIKSRKEEKEVLVVHWFTSFENV